MRRLAVGLVVSLSVGLIVAVSGLGRVLGLEDAVPPVPAAWAALPAGGGVDVTLVRSEGLVDGLAGVLSDSEVALHRPGAVALVDGRVIAVSGASVRRVLRVLAWDGLPIEARQTTSEALRHLAPPPPASLAWRARLRVYLGLRAARGTLAERPDLLAGTLCAALVLLLYLFPLDVRGRVAPAETAAAPSAWRRRRAEKPVRVVLVSDVDTLEKVRVAIGEEHVVAATEHAFAFAEGWILAVRKGSVFELLCELGWRMRPVEMATRPELVGEGHALSPAKADGAEETLDLLEALYVCGPLAHGGAPQADAGALSPA